MAKDVTKLSTMIELQGDIVLVLPDQVLLTIVHVVDLNRRYLELVDKTEKSKTRYGELTQAAFESMVKADNQKDPRVKWQLTL